MDTVVETKDFYLRSLRKGQEFYLVGASGWRLHLKYFSESICAAESVERQICRNLRGEELVVEAATTISLSGAVPGDFAPADPSDQAGRFQKISCRLGWVVLDLPFWLKFESDLGMQVLEPITQVLVGQF